jgi:hypothetical protein
VEFAPRTALRGPMLFKQPFARAAQLQLSIGTSMWDSGSSTGFRSLHVGFWGSRSRLK